TYYGEYRSVDDELRDYEKVTLADVRQVLDRYPVDRLTTLALGPLRELAPAEGAPLTARSGTRGISPSPPAAAAPPHRWRRPPAPERGRGTRPHPPLPPPRAAAPSHRAGSSPIR